jgi:phage head maturation protease
MPCEKCDNGKYKWGKTGSCTYDSVAECEEANKDYYEEVKETKIVELVIDESNESLAIDAISLVSAPAIEENMVYMSKAKNNLTLAKIDSEKQEIISPALIPLKNIYRYDADTDSDYYVYFSKDTVKRCAYSYLKNNNHHKATYQHEERVSGVLTVESWIIEDSKTDKSTLYGYSLPAGTWMVKMSITNPDLWEKVKTGDVKGLSIEGFFTSKYESMQNQKPTDQQILEALNEIINENQIKSK